MSSLRRVVDREGINAKNIVSWRVPNEPPPAKPDDSVGADVAVDVAAVPAGGGVPEAPRTSPLSRSQSGRSSLRSPKSPKSPLSATSSTSGSPAKNKRLANGDMKPRDGAPSTSLILHVDTALDPGDGGGSAADEASPSPSSHQYVSRLYTALFDAVNRSVDDLYTLCEERGDATMCEEASFMFQRSARDFTQLIERFENQKKFDEEGASSVSWEVRKPTAYAFPAMDARVVPGMGMGAGPWYGIDVHGQPMPLPLMGVGMGMGMGVPYGYAPVGYPLMHYPYASFAMPYVPADVQQQPQPQPQQEQPQKLPPPPLAAPTEAAATGPEKPALRAAAAPFQPVQPKTEAAGAAKTSPDAVVEPALTKTRSGSDDVAERVPTPQVPSEASVAEPPKAPSAAATTATAPARVKSAATIADRALPSAVDKKTAGTVHRQQQPPQQQPPPPPSSSSAPSSSSVRTNSGSNTRAPAAPRGAQQPKTAFGRTHPRSRSGSGSGSIVGAGRPMSVPTGKPRPGQRGVAATARSDKQLSAGTEETDGSDAEAEAEAEAAQASDLVWREVESWIEAEAQAEDAAWEVLAFSSSGKGSAPVEERAEKDDDVFDVDGADEVVEEDDEEDEEDEDEEDSWSAGIAGGGRGRHDPCFDTLKTQDTAAAPSLTLSRPPLKAGATSPMPPTPPVGLTAFSPLGALAAHGSPVYPFPSPQQGPGSPLDHALLAMRRSPPSSSSMITVPGASLKQSYRCVSPSNSSVVTSTTAASNSGKTAGAASNTSPAYAFGLNRSLHQKLSSPDRKRAVSPSEVKTKSELKQLSAEAKRDRNLAERRMKATLVLDRVKLRGERERTRLAAAEAALEERMREAERRHECCLRVIRDRAGNENTKVSEVMFINNMNAEGIVDQLRQKLVEVEARVLAAAERRQQILAGIAVRQRRRASRKAQQMSERRLLLEQEKEARWEKLQRRLEAVQQRRQARLAEMQRRSDDATPGAVAATAEDGAARADAAALAPAAADAEGAGESKASSRDAAETAAADAAPSGSSAAAAAAAAATSSPVRTSRAHSSPTKAAPSHKTDGGDCAAAAAATAAEEGENKENASLTDASALAADGKAGAAATAVAAKKRKSKARRGGAGGERAAAADEDMQLLESLLRHAAAAAEESVPVGHCAAGVGKHMRAVYRALRKKKGALAARDAAAAANAHAAAAPVDDRPALRHPALAGVFAVYLATAKKPSEGHGAHAAGATVDGLMRALCCAPADDPDSAALAPEAASAAALALLGRLDGRPLGGLGEPLDARKERGLFLRQGGVPLLRALLGPEAGLFAGLGFPPAAAPGAASDPAGEANAGPLAPDAHAELLGAVARACGTACAVGVAREAALACGLGVCVADAAHALALQFLDWHQHQQQHQQPRTETRAGAAGEAEEGRWAPEMRAWAPLLHASATLLRAGPEHPAACAWGAWVWYLFASGCVAAQVKAARALLLLHASGARLWAADEAHAHALARALLDWLAALAGALRPTEKDKGAPATATERVAQLTGRAAPPQLPRARDMVASLRDMQVALSLTDAVQRLAGGATAGATGGLLNAAEYSLCLSAVEALHALALADAALLLPPPPALGEVPPAALALLASLMALMELPAPAAATAGGRGRPTHAAATPAERAVSMSLRPSRFLGTHESAHEPAVAAAAATCTFQPLDADRCVAAALACVGIAALAPLATASSSSSSSPSPPSPSASAAAATSAAALLRLPERYFAEPRFQGQLLPPLLACVAAASADTAARAAVLSPLSAARRERVAAFAANLHAHHTPAARDACAGPERARLALLSHCLPVELWRELSAVITDEIP